jgi:hypothetical protein
MPGNPDDHDRDHRRDRGASVNPLAEILGFLPPDARKILRNVADEAAHAVRRSSGGSSPLVAAATTAAHLLSDAARQRPEAADFTNGPPRLRRSVRPAEAAVPAGTGGGSFIRLPQPGTDWWQFVRREAVVAVTSPAHDRCVVMLTEGRELEVGGSADAVARQIPGLVRLTQPGTQRCLYVRPSAVAAVTAPAQGCVLYLSNGRILEAGEAAVAAAGLIAGAG